MILCTTTDFQTKHIEEVQKSTGKQVWVGSGFTPLDRKEEVKVLLSYGNYDDIITEEQIRQLPNLQWIQLFSAGYDSLPFQALIERNIQVTTASGVHAKPISEYVLGAILHFYKNLDIYIENKQRRVWNADDEGEELEGKTIGILGTGHIGKEIARKCKLMGIRTIGINSTGRAVEHFDRTLPIDRVGEVLGVSDIICSVLPSNAQTIGLLNKELFELMKDGAVFINAGRGDLIVEEDLLSVMKRDKFKGVALDVFRQEPLPAEHPFWEQRKLIITPHISAKTDRYLYRCIDIFLENWIFFEAGRFHSMINHINISEVYKQLS